MGDNDSLSYRARLIRELVAEFNQNDFLKTKFREEKRSESDFDKSFRYPENYNVEKNEIGKEDALFNVELVTPKENASGWMLLQLHGGGYVGAFKNRYRAFAKMYAECVTGLSVANIDYRVAPEFPFPAALEDAVSAYEWLVEKGYPAEKIILAGDSAGGGLAMSLCHFLKDNSRDMPAGIVAMSPWTDLALTGDSYEENFAADAIFGNTRESLIYDNPYAEENERRNPYVSPLYGDFTGFPPMLIQAGGDEMLLSDSVSVAKKAKAAGASVRLSVYDGMFHVFQTAMRLMPESGRAWDEVRRFLKLVTQRKNPNSLRVALVERNIIWENKSENLNEIKKIMKLLEGKNADLVALPEMSLTGFSMNTKATSEPGNIPGAVCEAQDGGSKIQEINTVLEIKKLATEYGVSIGAGWVKKPEAAANETEKNDEENSDMLCENHYSIISRNGKMLLDYVKIHPFSFAGEDKYFKGGEKLSTCSIEGFETGVAICYDLRFPELFIRLAEKSELIIVPANWPAARSLHWKTLLRARAIENQCYVAGVNCSGDMDGQAYSGDSAIYSPEGEMLTPVETVTINETDKVYIYDIVNDVQEIRGGFPVRNDRKKGWM